MAPTWVVGADGKPLATIGEGDAVLFYNYRPDPFPGEDRACPPSPKVPTYDLQPEMSAVEVTRVAKEAILSGKYGLLVVN